MSSLDSWPAGHRYRLEQWLGAGGYSQVWRARDTVLDRQVAVKLLHSTSGDSEAATRFAAEARHGGALSHENIARVYDYGDPGSGAPPYLVLELVDGPSLAERLSHGPLPVPQALDVIAQAATGLDAAHTAGLVHRDIKPANLLLSPAGTLKITDFGISHALGSVPLTGTGMVMGTSGYLAPERSAGAGATAASDIYALGVVGYECLTGAPPFDGGPLEQALAHRERPLPPLPASVPADVAAFIAELTAKDPATRPPSAAAVARRARQLRDGLSAGLPMTSVAPAPAGSPAAPAPAPAGQPGYRQTRTLPQPAQPPFPEPQHVERPQRRRRAPRRRTVVIALCLVAVLAVLMLVSTALSGVGKPALTSPTPGASGSAPAHHAGAAAVLPGHRRHHKPIADPPPAHRRGPPPAHGHGHKKGPKPGSGDGNAQ